MTKSRLLRKIKDRCDKNRGCQEKIKQSYEKNQGYQVKIKPRYNKIKIVEKKQIEDSYKKLRFLRKVKKRYNKIEVVEKKLKIVMTKIKVV